MPLRVTLTSCALLLAACTGAAVQSTTATSLPPTTAPAATSPPTTLPPPSTEAPAPTEPKDPLTLQIEELMAVTEEIRGLQFLSTPEITVLSDEELADRVIELFEEDLDPAQFAANDSLYTTLGLLPEGQDLLVVLRDLQTEQVAGFYVPETKELVAPVTEGALTPTQALTMVHELTHALTDQHFDLFGVMDRLDTEQRYDDASAFRALLEGDATVVEIEYLRDLTREEQLFILQDVLSFESPVFDASPRFLQDSLLFPYTEGRELVSSIWTVDGFQGVDDAYFDLPTTTEHVYRPSTYFSGDPAEPVTLPALELDGYELIEASTWGYLGFQTMFDQVLGDAVADQAAEGWGGDRYELHWNGRDMAFVLAYVGDTEQDATEIHDALASFATTSMKVGTGAADGLGTAYTGDDYAFLSRVGDRVVFVVASDPSVGRSARAAFPEF